MKSTPGPWTVHDEQHCPDEVWGALDLEEGKIRGVLVCEVAGDNPLPNARLIAAAPELLAALEFIVNDTPEEGGDAQLTVRGYNIACAAISKAGAGGDRETLTNEQLARRIMDEINAQGGARMKTLDRDVNWHDVLDAVHTVLDDVNFLSIV